MGNHAGLSTKIWQNFPPPWMYKYWTWVATMRHLWKPFLTEQQHNHVGSRSALPDDIGNESNGGQGDPEVGFLHNIQHQITTTHPPRLSEPPPSSAPRPQTHRSTVDTDSLDTYSFFYRSILWPKRTLWYNTQIILQKQVLHVCRKSYYLRYFWVYLTLIGWEKVNADNG